MLGLITLLLRQKIRFTYLISLFTSAGLIPKPQPQHRTKSTLSGKSARSQVGNVVVEIVIAC